MTTFVDFLPTATKTFQFSPTFDGKQYSLVVTWGLAGQRWYINVYDQTGILIVFIPLVGSPDAAKILSLTWNDTSKLVTVTTVLPHGIPFGRVLTMTITGVIPDIFNGVWSLVSTGPNTMTYPQVMDPGVSSATTQGTIGRDINLVAGYFLTSALVFRQSTQRFETSTFATPQVNISGGVGTGYIPIIPSPLPFLDFVLSTHGRILLLSGGHLLRVVGP